MNVGLGLGFVLVCSFRFSMLCVFFWFSLDHFVFVVCFCCVSFSFFSTTPVRLAGKNVSKVTYFL